LLLRRSYFYSFALVSGFMSKMAFGTVAGADMSISCKGVNVNTLSDAELGFIGEALQQTFNTVHGAAHDDEILSSLTYSKGKADLTTGKLTQSGLFWFGDGSCGYSCPPIWEDDYYIVDLEVEKKGDKDEEAYLYDEWEKEFAAALNAGDYSALYTSECTILFHWTKHLNGYNIPGVTDKPKVRAEKKKKASVRSGGAVYQAAGAF
jgi:hypothetical protein